MASTASSSAAPRWKHPPRSQGWLKRYGAEKIGLAFDIRHDAQGVPRVLTRGWTKESKLTLWEAIESYLPHGLKHVLCTDAELDGALQGPAVALYAEGVKRYPQIAWQASGGVRSAADLAALAAIGSRRRHQRQGLARRS